MNTTASLPHRPFGASRALALVLGLTVIGACVTVGIAIGDPTPSGDLVLAAALGVAILTMLFARPYWSFLVLQTSAVMLIVVSMGEERSLTSFDLLLPLLFVISFWGGVRAEARAASEAEVGDDHRAIHVESKRFSHAVVIYFALALVSLIHPVLRGSVHDALASGEKLVRGIQGALMFPLGLWWLRSERNVKQTITAMLLGGTLLATINLCSLAHGDLRRAGITWFANEPLWSIGDPNEAAGALLLLWVLVLARNSMRFQVRNLVMLAMILVILVLTQSRSGLLAWLVFNVLVLARGRWKLLVLGVVLAAVVLPFVPKIYWERMARTLVLERGSFEAFSALVRVYGWHAAWRVFLDHPIFGVGYLGFTHLSAQYNDLGVYLLTTENIFMEAATGMGVIGLAALTWIVVRVYRLGAAVRNSTPPGSLGHHLAALHSPLVTGLLVVNMTANHWVGLVGIAQFALWNAILIRAGHGAITRSKTA
jgi:O-Antigen ligase